MVCCLFNDDVSSSVSISPDDGVIEELEDIWKEAVVAHFKELFTDLPGETEKNHEKSHLG